MVKHVIIVKYCQKIVNMVKNCQTIVKIVKKLLKLSTKIYKKSCPNLGQVMLPHDSDKMFQRLQVSRMALQCQKLKCLICMLVGVRGR